jgi:CHAD domain-containing protein
VSTTVLIDPPLPDALRAALLAELGDAIATLSDPTPENIHGARKSAKRARAYLRLMRGTTAHLAARQAERQVRDAGRLISELRDAHVLDQTLAGLAGGDERDAAALADLRASLRQEAAVHQHADHPVEAAAGALAEAREAVAALDYDWVDATALEAALRRSYRLARRRMREALKEETAEHLHAWRKAAKHHRHQCELLSALWPALAARGEALADLGDALGDHHDLSVALERLNERCNPEQIAGVIARAETRLRRSTNAAFDLGERLFADKPRKWQMSLSEPP